MPCTCVGAIHKGGLSPSCHAGVCCVGPSTTLVDYSSLPRCMPRHRIRRLHSGSAPQTRHQRQTSETNYSQGGNLRHTTHAKDLATSSTETPAARHIRSHESRHRVAPYTFICPCFMMDWEDMVGGERTTRASTASSLKLRRANARRPLTHPGCMPTSSATLQLRQ